MKLTKRCALAVTAAGMVVMSATAAADPIDVSSGKTVLPIIGLVVDLPARAGIVYHVSGSWSLADTGGYDARDVVDEFAGEVLQAGNWVLAGYFDAGECDAVLAEEDFDKDWKTTADLWGQHWSVRGGVFTFSNDLGRKPAVAICRGDGKGRSLLLYRFLITQPETISQEAVMADLRSASVLERASRAYDAQRVQSIVPLRRPEVNNRGKVAATRQVTLEASKLSLNLPDDGYVWLAHKGDGADMLDRMAPFFPETTLEVAAVGDADCDRIFQAASRDVETKPGREARNLPEGWRAGPAIVVDGNVEAVVCRPADYGVLVVGFFLDGNRTDATDYHPILTALAKATRTP